MTIKSDRWIKRMALEHGMIEPFEDRQVREGVISYGVSSYGYDIRVADEFKVFTNINSTVIDPEELRSALVRRPQGRRLHRPAELVRAGADGRVLQDPARRPHGVPRQVDLRALRHHRQRDAVRARVGRHGDARDLEHDAAARRRSTPTKASRRCCSSRATSRARSPTATRRASTRRSARSPCRGSSLTPHPRSVGARPSAAPTPRSCYRVAQSVALLGLASRPGVPPRSRARVSNAPPVCQTSPSGPRQLRQRHAVRSVRARARLRARRAPPCRRSSGSE